MKANRLLGAALTAGLGLAATSGTTVVGAEPKKGTPVAAPARAAEAPVTKKPITLDPPGIAWGMTLKQVGALIDKQLDESYVELYKKTSPGVNTKALDAQLIEEKSAFRRSRIDFGKLPTGIDSTPLKGEYSYMNKESLMILERNGKKKHFFFIQDKLWKIIDDHALSDASPQGKNFTDAVVKLAKTLGISGRVNPPAFDKGQFSTEIDWKDANTHLRAIERGDTALALAYEDVITLGNLNALRPNKPVESDGIDPAVAAATRKDDAPPAPPPPPASKKGTK